MEIKHIAYYNFPRETLQLRKTKMIDTPEYTGATPQAEVTGQGPYDQKLMDTRKALPSNVNRNECYPPGAEGSLIVLPGEPLLTRRHEGKHLAKNIAVFSSLNGEWYGRHVTKALFMRHFSPVGVAKVKHNSDSRYPNKSLISWIQSGSCKIRENTGNKIIPAGSLVCYDFPDLPLDKVIARGGVNWKQYGGNPGGFGSANGKYTLITKPFDPTDFSAHLTAYAALFKANKKATLNPGIADMSFYEMYQKSSVGNMKNDAQRASGALFYAIFGIWATVERCMERKRANGNPNVIRGDARQTLEKLGVFGPTKTQDAYDCVFSVMLQHSGSMANVRKYTDAFRKAHSQAFKNEKNLKNITDDKDIDVNLAYLEQDALTNLFGAIGDATYEQSRWIAGMCTEDSAPHKGLMVNIGNQSKPTSF